MQGVPGVEEGGGWGLGKAGVGIQGMPRSRKSGLESQRERAVKRGAGGHWGWIRECRGIPVLGKGVQGAPSA